MAKMNMKDALEQALLATKAYIDNNHYNQTEVDALLDTKSDEGHTHNYAGSSSAGGAATSANKVNKNLAIKLNGGTTEGTNLFTFNGSTAKTIDITPANIGAAKSSHGTHVTYSTSAPAANGTASAGSANNVARGDHVHPLQTSVSGNAGSADKVNNSLIIKINGGTTEGTNMFTFDGSGAKTINLKASDLGAPKSHTHDDRYYTETEINTKLSDMQGEINDAFDGYNTELQGEITRAGNAEAALQTAIDNEVTRATAAEAQALTDAKSYADAKVAAVLDSAPETLNTLNELAAALGNDPNFATTIAGQIGGKAPTSHASSATTYGVSSASNYGHAKASGTTPKANGTAAVGSETSSFARGDHVHPLQTSVSGNAGTATKFASAQSVALTGDVTGSASSQAGWSVATTLSNSGVTAGSYGQAENASPAHKGTFSVPYITVDAKGRVTAASTKTITLPADNNTTYTNEKLGNGYGTCETAEATAAKVVTLSNYTLTKNGVVSVKFTYAVPASATMNINSKGAKNIFYKGAAIVAGVIKAGDIATFIYDGTQYQLIAIDRWQDDTAGSIKALSVSGKTITYTKVNGTTGTITTQDTVYTHPTSGATAGSYGNSSNQTPAYGATFNVPYITVNAQGHITSISNKTVKIPASDKVTVTDNLTSTSTTAALSANQGKVLKGLVDNKVDMIEDTDLNTMLTTIFGTAAASLDE